MVNFDRDDEEAAQILLSLSVASRLFQSTKKKVNFKEPLIALKTEAPLIFSATKSIKSCLKKSGNDNQCESNKNVLAEGRLRIRSKC